MQWEHHLPANLGAIQQVQTIALLGINIVHKACPYSAQGLPLPPALRTARGHRGGVDEVVDRASCVAEGCGQPLQAQLVFVK